MKKRAEAAAPVRAALADTPYRLMPWPDKRHPPQGYVVLVYGEGPSEIREIWIRDGNPTAYTILINGKGYQFGGQVAPRTPPAGAPVSTGLLEELFPDLAPGTDDAQDDALTWTPSYWRDKRDEQLSFTGSQEQLIELLQMLANARGYEMAVEAMTDQVNVDSRRQGSTGRWRRWLILMP